MIPIIILSLVLSHPTPAIQLPGEVKGLPGRMVRLTAETKEKNVRWYLVSRDADLVPFPDGKIALFSAPKAGRYTVLAWTAAGDVPSDAAHCVVVISEAPVPEPVEPFVRDLRQLYTSDTTLNKADHVAQLAVLYREAIKYAEQSDVATAGDLAARIRAAAASLIPPEAIVGIRKRVAEEIAKELPQESNQPLDAANRTKAAQLFERIARQLEELK